MTAKAGNACEVDALFHLHAIDANDIVNAYVRFSPHYYYTQKSVHATNCIRQYCLLILHSIITTYLMAILIKGNA
jgi:hypothetical protein